VWYAPNVDWSERRCEGFALAAAARGDRGAERARAGLCADVAADATRVAARVAAQDASARRRWVRDALRAAPAAAAATRAVPAACPPRALGLLAGCVDKDLGRRWLANAPLPRPGFTPEPRLLALLRRLIGPHGDPWRA
jgi:hypothetical protein